MIARGPMADLDKKFTLRLPEDLHTALSEMAKEDDRSLHGMVVKLLRQAVAEWRASKTAVPTP